MMKFLEEARKENKLVGFSLSLVVRNMVEQKIEPDSVYLIVSGTCLKEDDLPSWVDHYFEKEEASQALQIVTELFAQNKIYQPRLYGYDPYLPVSILCTPDCQELKLIINSMKGERNKWMEEV